MNESMLFVQHFSDCIGMHGISGMVAVGICLSIY